QAAPVRPEALDHLARLLAEVRPGPQPQGHTGALGQAVQFLLELRQRGALPAPGARLLRGRKRSTTTPEPSNRRCRRADLTATPARWSPRAVCVRSSLGKSGLAPARSMICCSSVRR